MNPQIPNRTLFTGDNLPILRGLNGGTVDLVYLDPPFNSNKHYSAPVGSAAAGASFKDAWTLSDEDEAWHAALKSHQVFTGKVIHRTDIPTRTDIARIKLPRAQIKKMLYGNQAGLCNGCGIHFQVRNFETDHIVPKSHGGADVLENYQLLCGNCNRVKGERTMEYLKARLERRR